MSYEKFTDLTEEKKLAFVRENFSFSESEKGWLNSEGDFCGTTENDVILALIDLEHEEINTMGDCMGGYCVTPPKLTDFVRKR